MEQIITIIVLIAGAALSAWAKKKQQEPSEEASPSSERESPLAPAPRPQLGGDLAEILRRLMDPGQEPQPEPSLPPVIRSTPNKEIPIKVQSPVQKVHQEFKQQPTIKKGSTSFDAGQRMKETAHAFMHTGPSTNRVESKIQAIAGHGISPLTNPRQRLNSTINPEAGRVRALLRQPKTFREVMLASVVLSEPKNLTEFKRA
jgi:hypothetical protein